MARRGGGGIVQPIRNPSLEGEGGYLNALAAFTPRRRYGTRCAAGWLASGPGSSNNTVAAGSIKQCVYYHLAFWPLEPEFAGSIPAETVGFFRCGKNPQACLPSEGK
jgi:hypothetical protein